jgi:branched-chain amino acid transport system ATP-binding protein
MPDSQGLSLQTRKLGVRYGGVIANADINLSVPPGKIVGLIGPNGAGKTTFVDAVTGFAEYSGSVSLGTLLLDGMPPHERRRAGLSRTWQSGELFANLTVTQNVEAAARWGGPGAIWRDLFARRNAAPDPSVVQALEAVDLLRSSQTLARDLSLGQQKLVGVARALVGNCKLLLLDEPAAGLDSRESLEFATRLRQIVTNGPGALLIDHDMSLVLGICDHIYVLEFGMIIATGTAEEVRRNPAVIRAYLGTPMETVHG